MFGSVRVETNAPVTWLTALWSDMLKEIGVVGLPEQLTLNQRVQGSSPCAPTIDLPWLFSPLH